MNQQDIEDWENELTAKQRAFVREYLIDLNATQASIRAGYSAKTAAEQSSRLLRNVKVAAAISAAQKLRAQRTDITA
ncbi:terminase small subunit [Rhizobium sp. AG207R]|uniref:terminase small subunit n=1 Tax=Rhizobium sp. AG207R TaxID=2802287 RepID=UPI0022AC6039|nr:terminase small subunit [Rhizobium sp. AG207R]MCZ3380401.1 terminase small subunit [Rhizobium sp. AG207R]